LSLFRAAAIVLFASIPCHSLSAKDSAASVGRVTSRIEVPYLDGEPCVIASNPDLGKYTSEKQEPVDFGVWQAADGTWQLWSCIRGTNYGGKDRIFHRWEGKSLLAPNWTPKGIALEANTVLGETKGGLQAPYTFKHGGKFHMLYGDWVNICLAMSDDGKTFERALNADGTSAQFTQGLEVHIRDPMALEIEGVWHVYYTGNPDRKGKIYCRTTSDFKSWSEPMIVSSGGRAGDGRTAAECPQVVKHNGHYYLFRTERYGASAKTHVYVSSNPLHFGIDNDAEFYVTTIPTAAPEYVVHDGQEYLASLKPELNGIRIHALKWRPARDR
jgi:hypothetical protein